MAMGLFGCDGCRERPRPDPGHSASATLDEARAIASAGAEESGSPCARAHREISRLYAHLDAGVGPDEGAFLTRCEGLPEAAQHCLRPSRVADAPAGCAAVVEALPEPARSTARDLVRVRRER